jgi:hypothetical protein
LFQNFKLTHYSKRQTLIVKLLIELKHEAMNRLLRATTVKLVIQR